MSQPRKFEARYPGRCPACREAIEVGDDLTYDDDVVVHFDCAGRPAMLESIGRQVEVCPRCFLAKAANGACGCEP